MEGTTRLNLKRGDLIEIAEAVADHPELATKIMGIVDAGAGINYIPAILLDSEWGVIKATGVLKRQANR